MRPIVLAVLGPTASGKSALGLALAERYGGEIVNCDSTAVYRGFDIGTDKVAVEDRGAFRTISSTLPIPPRSTRRHSSRATRPP